MGEIGDAMITVIFEVWPADRDRYLDIAADLRPLLDNADAATLRGFVARQTVSAKNPNGISDPEFLSPAEANKVIAGLNGWLGRVRAKGGDHVGA